MSLEETKWVLRTLVQKIRPRGGEEKKKGRRRSNIHLTDLGEGKC